MLAGLYIVCLLGVVMIPRRQDDTNENVNVLYSSQRHYGLYYTVI